MRELGIGMTPTLVLQNFAANFHPLRIINFTSLIFYSPKRSESTNLKEEKFAGIKCRWT